MYFKGVLAGLLTVLVGLVVAPIAMIGWTVLKSITRHKAGGGETLAVSFSPTGLVNHLSHSLSFWILVVGLFSAGLLASLYLAKK